MASGNRRPGGGCAAAPSLLLSTTFSNKRPPIDAEIDQNLTLLVEAKKPSSHGIRAKRIGSYGNTRHFGGAIAVIPLLAAKSISPARRNFCDGKTSVILVLA
ncbi:hypothetical protein SAMN05216337_105039 [Bradyrhizobium brasilense]|uniref:Uncharacterized protein n=1 Tax=Bradyrhizobium brasilense TaxID=1419277 RepID=A0A1G7JWU3_9BRAD|nr:hypothetical protein [Bradyrhizobium brasilense]SDF29341.1 hypothetical protein SAMN05216337_105039 [Bradyrhizobium brasilense]